MNELQLPQLIVTVIAVVMILSPLLVVVFLAGRRSVVTGAASQFDRIASEFSLVPGTWRVEIDGDDPGTTQIVMLDLQQFRNRVVGMGQSVDGSRYSLEGVIHGRQLFCISMDESRYGISLATLTAEMLPGENRMIGMRSRWSSQSQTLAVRKAIFSREIG